MAEWEPANAARGGGGKAALIFFAAVVVTVLIAVGVNNLPEDPAPQPSISAT